MHFSKYHGIGNDFIVTDLRVGGELDPSPQDPTVVTALCDRNFGVGADGVLAILPPLTAGAAARMRVLNADGSEAEMCGNGLRCVAKHLYERDSARRSRGGAEALAQTREQVGPSSSLIIDTGAGPLTCTISDQAGVAVAVTVDMGRPILDRARIPLTGPSDERCVATSLAGHDLSVTAVSMGNPHCITFVDATAAALRTLAESVGPAVEHHSWFPQRTNAEFARIAAADEIELVVWERGVGITLACGTGACATVVGACLNGLVETDRDVTVHLLGGDLVVRVAADYSGVVMRGAAAHVYDADIDLAALMI